MVKLFISYYLYKETPTHPKKGFSFLNLGLNRNTLNLLPNISLLPLLWLSYLLYYMFKLNTAFDSVYLIRNKLFLSRYIYYVYKIDSFLILFSLNFSLHVTQKQPLSSFSRAHDKAVMLCLCSCICIEKK